MGQPACFKPRLEMLENRTSPARIGAPPGLTLIVIEGGVLRIEPKSAADAHDFVHFHPKPGVVGLKTAEALRRRGLDADRPELNT